MAPVLEGAGAGVDGVTLGGLDSVGDVHVSFRPRKGCAVFGLTERNAPASAPLVQPEPEQAGDEQHPQNGGSV
jgi:hypothetical protein